MENMKIRNDNLALYLGFKLNKIGNEFTAQELSNLKELNMNQLNDFEEYEDIDLEVLDYTPNLETLVLKNFEITPELINKLKNIKNLKSVSFERCIIDDFNLIRELDVDYLAITKNAFLRTDFLKGKKYKALVLTDSDLIDIDNIKDMEGLETLYVSNSNVKNPELIGNFSNLSILHIENSNIEDISFLKNMNNLRSLGINRNLYEMSKDTVNCLKERKVDFLDNGYIPIVDIEEFVK